MTSPHDPGPPPEGPTPQDPYQQPQHPPPYGYWPYPPPARSRTSPWMWVSLGLGLVVALLLVVVVGIGWFWSSWGAYDDDYYDSEDASYYYVDQRRVDNAMEPVCDTMQDAAAEVQLFGSVANGRASLEGIADTSRGMATAIDGAKPDADAKKLSADWSSLATALDSFTTELADDPAARFTMPETDGDYVSDRISWGNDVCYVPTIVIALDPEVANSNGGSYGY